MHLEIRGREVNIFVTLYNESDKEVWDRYVYSHPFASLYHLSGWKTVIEQTYGKKSYYLMAVNRLNLKDERSRNDASAISAMGIDYPAANQVVGILPLIHLKHFLFGNRLISIPYFDMGGIVADDKEVEIALLLEAIKLGQKLKVNNIEFRHTEPLKILEHESLQNSIPASILYTNYRLSTVSCATKSHKVRMILELPESSNALMQSFKSKLRSQVNRPIKDGLISKIGRSELLDDFYKIFLTNMRDLGSPVHSKRLIYNVLKEFPQKTNIVTVYKDDKPLACSMVMGFKDTLENPWASSLRQFSRLNPNMYLYWTMLEYACNNGFKYFDFGRSTPDEGTYKFKEQWGSKAKPLHWQYISLSGKPISEGSHEKSRFDKAIQYWQRLPIPVTRVIGPMIRKHIGL